MHAYKEEDATRLPMKFTSMTCNCVSVTSSAVICFSCSILLLAVVMSFLDLLHLQDLDDMNIEIMRNTLYKAYLEDFYRFCQVRLNNFLST